MGLQLDAPLLGGAVSANAYVRISGARVFRRTADSAYNLIVDVDVFKDKDSRDAAGPQLTCPSLDKHKFAYSLGDEAASNLIALGYARLKTLSDYSGASDV